MFQIHNLNGYTVSKCHVDSGLPFFCIHKARNYGFNKTCKHALFFLIYIYRERERD